MACSLLKYNICLQDYKKGNYLNITNEEKKNLLSLKEYDKIVYYLNDKSYSLIFLDKLLFNRFFEKYLKRDYIDIRNCSLEQFEQFLNNKKEVFAKILCGSCGKGVTRINVNNTDHKRLYKHLYDNKQYLVEDAIIQHEKLNEINSMAVNNVRIVTLVVDKKVHIIAKTLRTSNGVDYIDSNDIMITLDNNGKSIKPFACDDWLNTYYEHPITHFPFKDTDIPYMKEAISMVSEAALLIPEIRYVGWDVAITPTGPCLIEGNFYPSYGLHQYYLLNDNYYFKKQLTTILKGELKEVNIKK